MAEQDKIVPARDKDVETRTGKGEVRHDPASETARFLVPMSAMLAGRRWRLTARAIGLGFFIAGAALLIWVFIEAVQGFSRLGSSNYLQSEINKIGGDQWQIVTAGISVVGGELLRLLYLLLLGMLGSLIASKGIQFFAASESVIDEAVLGMEEEV